MSDDKYRVQQLTRGNVNGHVHDYESLETHHPISNRNARMVEGRPVAVEGGNRQYAMVDGEFEEVLRAPARDINPGQTLVSKDFILSNHRGQRDVDVLSPVQGYVGRVDTRQGLVDIYDRQGGDVIARIRHMRPLLVEEGDSVAYGQAVGVQGNAGTRAVHAHMDVDIRYLNQFKTYVEDLTQGRLRIDPAHRQGGQQPGAAAEPRAAAAQPEGVRPQGAVLKDGSEGPNVRDLQTSLAALGYTGMDGKLLTPDSDFGANTDHAVRAFQQAHGLQPIDGKVGADTRAALAQAAQRPLVSEASHPNHALYAQLGRQLPAGTDPRITASITLQAMENGITSPEKLERMAVQGNDVFLLGTTPGDRLKADLQAPVPELQASSDHMAAQSAQARQREQADQRSRQQEPQAVAL